MDKDIEREIRAREESFDPKRSYITCNDCGKRINVAVTAMATTALHMEICPGVPTRAALEKKETDR